MRRPQKHDRDWSLLDVTGWGHCVYTAWIPHVWMMHMLHSPSSEFMSWHAGMDGLIAEAEAKGNASSCPLTSVSSASLRILKRLRLSRRTSNSDAALPSKGSPHAVRSLSHALPTPMQKLNRRKNGSVLDRHPPRSVLFPASSPSRRARIA